MRASCLRVHDMRFTAVTVCGARTIGMDRIAVCD
jgi:hypothetical protein